MSLKTYQWIKGEKAGNVVKGDGGTFMDDNIEYVIFNDGSRCNSQLLGDYIIEIASDHEDDLIMLNDTAPAPMRLIVPPIDVPPVVPVTTIHIIAPTEIPNVSVNPLEALLSSSKKIKQKITIVIDVETPPADLIKVVASSFDDGKDQIRNYLINGWTQEQQNAVRKQVADHIMNNIFTKKKNIKYEGFGNEDSFGA